MLPILAIVAIGTAWAGSCKDVDISVKNDTGVTVDAKKIEYKTLEDGTWRTELFSNTFVTTGTTGVVATSQNLQYIEGQTMTHIKLHFNIFCPKPGGGTDVIALTHTDTTFDQAQCNSNSGKTYRVDLPANAAGC